MRRKLTNIQLAIAMWHTGTYEWFTDQVLDFFGLPPADDMLGPVL